MEINFGDSLLSAKVFIVIILDHLEKIFKANTLLPYLLSKATASFLFCFFIKLLRCHLSM